MFTKFLLVLENGEPLYETILVYVGILGLCTFLWP